MEGVPAAGLRAPCHTSAMAKFESRVYPARCQYECKWIFYKQPQVIAHEVTTHKPAHPAYTLNVLKSACVRNHGQRVVREEGSRNREGEQDEMGGKSAKSEARERGSGKSEVTRTKGFQERARWLREVKRDGRREGQSRECWRKRSSENVRSQRG
ncbi:hypothetical protein EDB89DRAFT_1910293 [Lactarius sanguifluus]|nr:hypothetical protein EDB89DRAFT_1910293 [Lactarius sanguifluus]